MRKVYNKLNEHFLKILIIFLLTITLFASKKILAQSSATCQDNDNECGVNCGVVNDNDCIQKGVNLKMFALANRYLDLSNFKRNVDELTSQGVLWIRLPIFEWEIAGRPGTKDNIPWNSSALSKYDEAINYAKSKGLKIWLSHAFPNWAKDYSHEDYKKLVENFVNFLSSRYKNKIDIWQVFNESDIHNFKTYECLVKPDCRAPESFPSGYLDQLKDILSTAKKTIKQNDPHVIITTNVGGYPPFPQSWKAFFDAISPEINAISLDIYPEKDEVIINSLPQKISEYRTRYNKPIYIAETGMQTYSYSEEEQKIYLLRYLERLKEGRANLIFLYEYQNSSPENSPDESDTEAAFGIKKRDGSKKLAYNEVILKLKAGRLPPYPPIILPSSCDQTCIGKDSCSCTLDWGDVLGATNYPLRVDDRINGWAGTCDPTKVYSGDICIDNLNSSNYTFIGKNGHTYNWWVHAVNSLGWSEPAGKVLNVNCNCPPQTPGNIQSILDYWSDEVYRIYKDTDLTSLINNIQGRMHLNVNAVRSLAGQAMMHLYYYFRNNNLQDFNKAQFYLEKSIEKYPNWQKLWGSAVTMNQLAFDFWWVWDKLNPDLRSRFLDTLVEEANFWTWVLNEIKTNPNGFTIPEEAGRRRNQNNLSLITTNPLSNDHLNDTRAEENAWNAQLLATAYSMLPNHPNAQSWNEAAKCFAYHTFSKGESACGITSRTISDDFTLGNHNLWPYPLYTLAGITGLQQGQFSYLLAGLPVPQEFFHNIEERINSGVWRRNITQCMNDAFEITNECHAGKDWGDRNLQVSSMMLGYWAGLQNDAQAQELMEKILKHFYSIRMPIRYPYSNPVTSITQYTQTEADQSLQWWTNLERHPQISAKILSVSKYQNQEFRTSFFPQQLKICEENFLKKKVWEGNLNWVCDERVKKIGQTSLNLTSNQFSNAEIYSLLIKVEPNQIYKVSYWVKTENLQIQDAQVYGRIIPAQYNQNAKEKDQVDQNRIDAGFSLGENVSGTTNWQEKSYFFKTTPTTSYVRLRAPLALAGKAKGSVWFDGVKFERIQPATLSLHLKFQGISHQAGGKNVRVILKQGDEEKYRFDSVTVNADANGVYSGTINDITPGTYDVFIKAPAHLQKKFANITLNSGTNTFDWSETPLKAGDFDNNNVLNIADINSLLSKYTALTVPVTTENKNFDVDGNNVININDISLVLANYTALEVPGDN